MKLVMRTNVMLCDAEECTSYLVPQSHLHPQPYGKPRSGNWLSDTVHADEEAMAADWVVAIKTDEGRIDLCPACIAAAEKEARGPGGGRS